MNIRRIEANPLFREFVSINNILYIRCDRFPNVFKDISSCYGNSIQRAVEFYTKTLGFKEVAMKYDPSDVLAFSGNCCGGPNFYGGVTKNGKSHALDCPEISKSQPAQGEFSINYERASSQGNGTGKKCGCGSSAVGSDRHSDYCDLYTERS